MNQGLRGMDNSVNETILIGGRRELFLDDYLIDRMAAGAKFLLHRPVRREIVFRLAKGRARDLP